MSASDDPRTLLRGLEQRARRRFGQHFLTRTDIVQRMVRAARVAEGERVVEVGPGLGILTEVLLGSGADLTAIELDRDLAAFLRERHPGLDLVEADALRVDWTEYAGAKVVSNLPYNVGTRLVMQMLRRGAFASITVMLQREVVDRMLAEAGNRTYGALTVQLAVRAERAFVLAVPPSAFHPPPKVDSAVIRLVPYDNPDTGGTDPDHFDRVVQAAFAHRRKTIANSLQSLFPKDRVAAALAQAGIDPRARAETLDPPAFRALAAALADGSG